jgi:hypothetical protein
MQPVLVDSPTKKVKSQPHPAATLSNIAILRSPLLFLVSVFSGHRSGSAEAHSLT